MRQAFEAWHMSQVGLTKNYATEPHGVYGNPFVAAAYEGWLAALAWAEGQRHSSGVSLRIGDRLKDNDPRSYGGNRVLEITDVQEGHVFARHGNLPWTRIRIDRIYTDSKPRKSGFTLLPKQAAPKE